MAKHLTKAEILAKIKHAQAMKVVSDRSPFSAMCIMCNYILWKEYKWEQDKLADYNMRVAAYNQELDAGDTTMGKLSDRLTETADLTITYEEYTEEDVHLNKKNKFLYELEKSILESNNLAYEMSTRYSLMHFNTLIDMGYDAADIDRNKDLVNQYLATMETGAGERIEKFRKALYDEVGIDIEMPSTELKHING